MDHNHQETLYSRPLWQWLLMYLLIGFVIYTVVYFVWIRRGAHKTYTAQSYWADMKNPSY